MSDGRLFLRDVLATGERSFSFEFFPPKTDEGERQLWQAISELEPLRPTFVSVTYGAGGSTRDRTTRITCRIAAETPLTPVAHLTCVGVSRAELLEILDGYAEGGVRNVLALRGDPPREAAGAWEPHPEGLRYGSELVALVSGRGGFSVGVAAHPETHPQAESAEADARHLVEKFEAGADFAVTQFFFEAQHYFRLVERVAALGCTKPIIPGIMPVTNVSQIERMAQMSGAAFPPRLAERLRAVEGDAEAVRAIGVEVATDLCDELLAGGAPGLHFFTLNRSTATREIYERLRLPA